MEKRRFFDLYRTWVSVLFNEPKLLKLPLLTRDAVTAQRFSALQRAEIAEIERAAKRDVAVRAAFQCSSTSRNC